jgi:outer membrane protein OmpA-like peptidoglycan-associated protein
VAVTQISKAIRGAMVGVSAAVVALAISGGEATAKPKANTDEAYVPTIWIDPDGCEHWAMDDGAEGYMDIRLDRNGKPICHRGQVCGVMPTDQLFATDKSAISASGRARLEEFFRKANARAYTVIGHTDSRSSDEYNMRLSRNRAEAVARVAKGVGANLISVQGYGERQPRATNATKAGMAQNRRVEIICIR